MPIQIAFPIPDYRKIQRMNDEVEDWNKEIWRTIPGVHGKVSNYGRIKRLFLSKYYKVNDQKFVDAYPTILSSEVSKKNDGKVRAKLRVKSGRGRGKAPFGYYVIHRLVALCFIPNPEPEKNKIINHMDGLGANNLWTNLEWCDNRHNVIHAIQNNMVRKRFDYKYHSIAHLKPESALWIKEHFMPYSSIYGLYQMSYKYKISYENIWAIVQGKLFPELPPFEIVNKPLNGDVPVNAYFYLKGHKKYLKMKKEMEA